MVEASQHKAHAESCCGGRNIEVVAYKGFLTWALGAVATFASGASAAQDSYLAEAKAYVARISRPNPPWDGPTRGPAAQPNKSVIYVSADQNNGGARGVGRAVEEAAKVIGWGFRLIDGQGTPAGRAAALEQAADLNPDGIILGTIDAKEQATVLRRIAAKGIKIVGWHALGKPGPAPAEYLVINIATDPKEVAKAAAMYAVADSNGGAAVVIFTDPAYEIGLAKSDAMADFVRKCTGCSVLSVERIHHGEFRQTSALMTQRTALLLQRHGARWTYGLADNDLYFDFMLPSLMAAAIPGNGYPRNISAGDGSETAYERIRKNHYQAGTVAEPLRLHGWQAVDEMNRAFAGQKDSGYSTPVHLVTAANIQFDGGQRNEFDPDNGYREAYKTTWRVK
jgi:ribose transport system substrate-binding protein